MMLAVPDVSGPINTQLWAIEGVRAEVAAVPWRRCWQLLGPAADRFPEARDKWTSHRLLADVQAGNSQLWIAWSYQRRHVEGAVITRLFDKPTMAPNDKVCEIPLVGGVNFREWGGQLLGLIKAWAIDQNCTVIAGYGRRGWKRMFGFIEVGKTDDGLPIFVLPLRGVA